MDQIAWCQQLLSSCLRQALFGQLYRSVDDQARGPIFNLPQRFSLVGLAHSFWSPIQHMNENSPAGLIEADLISRAT
jgi:hypothetical protein